jgi:hypothetical protein
MELALNLGWPAELLSKSMTAAELDGWAKYASRIPLPHKRMEIMLAQLSLLIARTMGGAKNVSVKDFMLALPDVDIPDNVVRLRQAFGFKPRIKPKA